MAARTAMVTALVVALSALVPAVASASYACDVSYVSSGNTYPAYVVVAYYSQTGCVGYQYTYFYCHKAASATTTQCAANDRWRYERDELLALYHELVTAAGEQRLVFAYSTTCNGGASGCGSYVAFH